MKSNMRDPLWHAKNIGQGFFVAGVYALFTISVELGMAEMCLGMALLTPYFVRAVMR